LQCSTLVCRAQGYFHVDFLIFGILLSEVDVERAAIWFEALIELPFRGFTIYDDIFDNEEAICNELAKIRNRSIVCLKHVIWMDQAPSEAVAVTYCVEAMALGCTSQLAYIFIQRSEDYHKRTYYPTQSFPPSSPSMPSISTPRCRAISYSQSQSLGWQ
jgi:hypothetical protein